MLTYGAGSVGYGDAVSRTESAGETKKSSCLLGRSSTSPATPANRRGVEEDLRHNIAAKKFARMPLSNLPGDEARRVSPMSMSSPPPQASPNSSFFGRVNTITSRSRPSSTEPPDPVAARREHPSPNSSFSRRVNTSKSRSRPSSTEPPDPVGSPRAARGTSSLSRSGNLPAREASNSPRGNMTIRNIASAKRVIQSRSAGFDSPSPRAAERRFTSRTASPEQGKKTAVSSGDRVTPNLKPQSSHRKSLSTPKSPPSDAKAGEGQGSREAMAASASPKGPDKSFFAHFGGRGGPTHRRMKLTQEEKEAHVQQERERERERERAMRLEKVDRDLAEIMARHSGSLGRRRPPSPAPRTGPFGRLSRTFKDSFAEMSLGASHMSPIQQRELMLKQTSVHIGAVEEALAALKSEAAHPPTSPAPPAHPKASPSTMMRYYNHHDYPPPGQADELKETLSRQAIFRHDLTSVLHVPATRGLMPSLPSSVVLRASYRINGIYRAHVQGTERMDAILQNVCAEARVILTDREVVRKSPEKEPRKAGPSVGGHWEPATVTCAADPPQQEGTRGLLGTQSRDATHSGLHEGGDGGGGRKLAGAGGRAFRAASMGFVGSPRGQARGCPARLDSTMRVMVPLT